jgi:hypothetical protein
MQVDAAERLDELADKKQVYKSHYLPQKTSEMAEDVAISDDLSTGF